MNSVGNNSAITYQAANVGVLTAPDKIGQTTLYSEGAAEKQYQELTKDIYDKQKTVNPTNKYSTPKGIYCALGAGVLTFLWTVCKKLIKK